MRDFRTFRVWQDAHAFVLAVYRATATFPVAERYGLSSQLRRAATSITNALAEGSGAGTPLEERRFFRIAFRSSCEALNELITARDLNFLDQSRYEPLDRQLETVRRRLYRLIEKAV